MKVPCVLLKLQLKRLWNPVQKIHDTKSLTSTLIYYVNEIYFYEKKLMVHLPFPCRNLRNVPKHCILLLPGSFSMNLSWEQNALEILTISIANNNLRSRASAWIVSGSSRVQQLKPAAVCFRVLMCELVPLVFSAALPCWWWFITASINSCESLLCLCLSVKCPLHFGFTCQDKKDNAGKLGGMATIGFYIPKYVFEKVNTHLELESFDYCFNEIILSMYQYIDSKTRTNNIYDSFHKKNALYFERLYILSGFLLFKWSNFELF